MTPTLQARNISVNLDTGEPVVHDVSFAVQSGSVLGVVGESGSGKTTAALALLGFARRGMRLTGGTVDVAGQTIVRDGRLAATRVRGRVISYVPQDPSAALNPSLRVGAQVAEMIRVHASSRNAVEAVERALVRVQLPPDRDFQRRFPHQLSGGQQQRVSIAKALVCDPPVGVFDEPTTGLDVITQAHLLEQIHLLRQDGLALVYVSHDLAVVASIADRIAVMYAGEIVEEGPTNALLMNPRHPYTVGLIASIPDHRAPRRLYSMPGIALGVGERPSGCAFAERCPQRIPACEAESPALLQVQPDHVARCIRWRETPRQAALADDQIGDKSEAGGGALLSVWHLHAVHAGSAGITVAARDVSFAIGAGECVALVGESGSGKTTIARCVAGLHRDLTGTIDLDGTQLAPLAAQRPREARRRIQIVFQNATESLNPRRRVHDTIVRPARFLRDLSPRAADAEVGDLLARVRLPAALADRYPAELSGGERQRVAIARALAAHPDLIVCDEITSALDVSVQAAVIDVLHDLRRDLGLSLLFISHDLGVVATVSDRILVLERGSICEEGIATRILSDPAHPYTRDLITAAPTLDSYRVAD